MQYWISHTYCISVEELRVELKTIFKGPLGRFVISMLTDITNKIILTTYYTAGEYHAISPNKSAQRS